MECVFPGKVTVRQPQYREFTHLTEQQYQRLLNEHIIAHPEGYLVSEVAAARIACMDKK